MAASSAARTKRNYTEKDLILKIEQVEKRIVELTEAVRQLSDQLEEKSLQRKGTFMESKGYRIFWVAA